MASEKILKFVEEIKTLTVLELNELVKAIKEEFGVSAAAPVAVAAAGAGGGEDHLGGIQGKEVEAEAGEHGPYNQRHNGHGDHQPVFLLQRITPQYIIPQIHRGEYPAGRSARRWRRRCGRRPCRPHKG